MTTNDKAAGFVAASAKTDWVKPEIVSFVPAVEAQANLGGTINDGNPGNNS